MLPSLFDLRLWPPTPPAFAEPGVLLPVAAVVVGDAAASVAAAKRRCSCVVRTPGCDGYFAFSRIGRFARVDDGVPFDAGDDMDVTAIWTVTHLPSRFTSR